jgi:hypothetical protein
MHAMIRSTDLDDANTLTRCIGADGGLDQRKLAVRVWPWQGRRNRD